MRCATASRGRPATLAWLYDSLPAGANTSRLDPGVAALAAPAAAAAATCRPPPRRSNSDSHSAVGTAAAAVPSSLLSSDTPCGCGKGRGVCECGGCGHRGLPNVRAFVSACGTGSRRTKVLALGEASVAAGGTASVAAGGTASVGQAALPVSRPLALPVSLVVPPPALVEVVAGVPPLVPPVGSQCGGSSNRVSMPTLRTAAAPATHAPPTLPPSPLHAPAPSSLLYIKPAPRTSHIPPSPLPCSSPLLPPIYKTRTSHLARSSFPPFPAPAPSSLLYIKPAPRAFLLPPFSAPAPASLIHTKSTHTPAGGAAPWSCGPRRHHRKRRRLPRCRTTRTQAWTERQCRTRPLTWLCGRRMRCGRWPCSNFCRGESVGDGTV
eukprot:365129-Chlamydomonas_euryale.AAC.1